MIRLLAEAESGGYLHETWQLITDPAHLTAEFLTEIATNVLSAIIFYPVIRFFAKKWISKHDQEVHGECPDSMSQSKEIALAEQRVLSSDSTL